MKTENKPEFEYSEFVRHNGLDLELLAENFKEPIKKSDTVSLHARLSVINTFDGNALMHLYWTDKTMDELKEIVRYNKKNIDQLLPKSNELSK